ncbi:plasmid mobilization relaxosome protein MobC [Shewanella sp. 202IG2-18]|uniref:plasmid mobilization protein n=1 Tax=Parashewanella hymeniacidonis TaxID=2807618 RepID=UPI0019617779|nr:plasmid mobilization relaxosome protein MobC [Parashewanella hymeniacidonis]MBM7074255.1 plasmid mobilization relaxosome protein MobC [Parashewanella hymeniacidonis]
MARIEILLSDEEKSNLRHYCDTKGITASSMVRTLINQSSPDTAITSDFREVKTNKITVRFSANNLHAIAARAKSEGYVSQTNWATACILSQLYKQPVLSNEETNVLRQSNRQLAAIGRNLNQIARVLNIEFRESDKITKDMIEMLESKINQHKQKVSDLLNKNCQRWSIPDAPFIS